jgi:hypothetical protein
VYSVNSLGQAINQKALGTVLYAGSYYSVGITYKMWTILQTVIEMKLLTKKPTTDFYLTRQESHFIELPWGLERLEEDYLVP